MRENQASLTGGSRLARNVIWNFIGTGSPLLVAIFAIPWLIDGLGLPRFGLLTIAWMLVGYFSLFDLGLGRALTKLVAERLGSNRQFEIPPLVWTGMLLMVALGLLGGLFVGALTPWLVDAVLKIPAELKSESKNSFFILASAIPIVIATTGLRGVLEARQRFDLVNYIRIPLGLATYLGPLLILPFSTSLVPVVFVLVIARFAGVVGYIAMCFQIEPMLRRSVGIDRSMIGPLLNFGGWMTVSNVVSPLMVYMDRFLIGSVISMTAVAYYTTPYEIVTKLLIIPGALMGVLFPAFATAIVQNKAYAGRLFGRANNYVFVVLFPAVLCVVTLAYDGLSLWLGVDFAANSTIVLQLLAVGVLINSQAQVPFGLIQGAGRPDLTAKLHVVEFLFYLPLLWLMVNSLGIIGAAITWVARMAVDTVILFAIALKLVHGTPKFSLRAASMICVSAFSLWLGAVISPVFLKTMFLLAFLSVFVIVTWFKILDQDERALIWQKCNAFRASK